MVGRTPTRRCRLSTCVLPGPRHTLRVGSRVLSRSLSFSSSLALRRRRTISILSCGDGHALCGDAFLSITPRPPSTSPHTSHSRRWLVPRKALSPRLRGCGSGVPPRCARATAITVAAVSSCEVDPQHSPWVSCRRQSLSSRKTRRDTKRDRVGGLWPGVAPCVALSASLPRRCSPPFLLVPSASFHGVRVREPTSHLALRLFQFPQARPESRPTPVERRSVPSSLCAAWSLVVC
mmetsp:Transcript_17059/g.40718  ORF Transcript_17059/g.40718 Transcript_17059/m.40718 type:complete len:235 (-) Transcript_17059:646-1350(-)